MFGNRKKYLHYFELWIPEALYEDWSGCLLYHDIAIEAVKANDVPNWFADERIQPAAAASINRTTINIEAGEMTFDRFDWSDKFLALKTESKDTTLDSLNILSIELDAKSLPHYVINFIRKNSFSDKHLHINVRKPGPSTSYYKTLFRPRGVIGGTKKNLDIYPNATFVMLELAVIEKEAPEFIFRNPLA